MFRNRSNFDIGSFLEISRTRNRPKVDDPFEFSPLELGMSMYIDTKINGAKIKPMQCQLVGHVKGQYLILSTPKVEGMTIKYNENNLVNIHYLSNRTVYSFQSKVLRVLGPPFYFTIFQMPDQIKETPLRGSQRIKVGIPFDRAGGDPNREYILNLSASGALIKLSNKMPINSDLSINFFLPNGYAVSNLNCIVKRVDMNGKRMLAGVEFDTSHRDYQAIGQYIDFVLTAHEHEQEELENVIEEEEDNVRSMIG